MEAAFDGFLGLLALPRFGLGALFLVAFASATLLPLGSEPALFGVVQMHPTLFWIAVLVATVGNTLGGAVTWWMGYAAERAYAARHAAGQAPAERRPPNPRALRWLQRWGPRACLLSWLPVVGDPLCAVAGWLRLPFGPCVGYMAIGKGLRYVAMTVAAIWIWPAA